MHHDPVAAEFDRDSLERRARRIELVTKALRDRAVFRHAVTLGTPTPLHQAIAAYELELDGIRRRLGELS